MGNLYAGHVAPAGPQPSPPIAMVLKDGEPRPVSGRAFFSADFDFGDRVSIDRSDVTGTVIGFCFYPHGLQVQVSWWNSGALVEQWIGEERLQPIAIPT